MATEFRTVTITLRRDLAAQRLLELQEAVEAQPMASSRLIDAVQRLREAVTVANLPARQAAPPSLPGPHL